MNIKFKNGHLSILIQLLHSLELKAKESRMRTRFKNILVEHNDKIVKPEKQALIDEYAKFDEKGKHVFRDISTGELDISEENSIIINENINELMCEEFSIECNESNKDMLMIVSKILLDGDFTLSGDYADAYDEWCEMFEEVIEHFNNKINT